MLLATVGLYGITSYATSQRRKEIRRADGAGCNSKEPCLKMLMRTLLSWQSG